jgi:serine phosphatase RsbU (regulator of sigma subunit)
MADRQKPISRLHNGSRWSNWSIGRLFESRFRRITYWIVVASLFAITGIYRALTSLVKFSADTTTDLIYTTVVVVCFGMLFVALSYHYSEQRQGVLRIFWRSTVYASLLFGALAFVPDLAMPGEFRTGTGVPDNIRTVFRTVLLSPLVVVFAMALLLRFRELVMFKRTRRAMRQWYAMIAAMVVASLSLFGADPALGINVVTGILLGISVILMVANSFRLSRILYMNMKEKATSIALSLVLLVVLILAVVSSTSGLLPGRSHLFLWTYSPALNLFAFQCVLFGIMYCMTAGLSLLFHLPTTSEFQQKAGELAAMHTMARLTREMLNRDMMVRTIVGSPVDAGMCSTAWLTISDPRTGSLRPRIAATRNTTPDQINELFDLDALYDEAATRKEPLLLNQSATDHRVRARPGDGMSSLLVVPMLVRKDVVGALFVAKEISHGFETDDIETVKTFADQAALAIDNARLFEEQIEKERLSRELVIAREVQRKLLPQSLPEAAGLSVAASSVSAQEVGGDYYDFVRVDDHKWAFIVADVSGKGTSAAFYMAEMKGVFGALSRLTDSPAMFLEHANRALSDSMEKNIFISAVYGVLDVEKETFTLARAGHCPVVAVNHSGQSRYLRTEGLGLGMDRGVIFKKVLQEEAIVLSVGDVFVLYTDGVVESRNDAGEEFGYDRLMEAVCRHHGKPVADLHAALLGDLNRFLGEKAYDDDMTLLVLRWDGRETDRNKEAYASATKQLIPDQK